MKNHFSTTETCVGPFRCRTTAFGRLLNHVFEVVDSADLDTFTGTNFQQNRHLGEMLIISGEV